MIRKATVFVLGAGASERYGLWPGGTIADEIRGERAKFGPLADRLGACDFSDSEIANFFNRFTDSGQYSVDAFVQRHSPPPDLRRIAKATVAARLLLQEDHESLTCAADNVDWYRALFTGMFPTKSADFAQNNLKIITFNFDRSFERRLYLMLEATYTLTDRSRLREMCSWIPILHLHGDLGYPAWLLPEDRESEGRHYRRDSTPETILQCVDRIKMIDDEMDGKTTTQALQWLDAAERILFVGFGFHPDNVSRLQCDRLGNKAMWGTTKGMASNAVQRVYQILGSIRSPFFFDCTARELLDRVDLS